MANDHVFGFGFRIFAKNETSRPAQEAVQAMNKVGRSAQQAAQAAQQGAVNFQNMTNQGITPSSQAVGFLTGKMYALIAAITSYLSIRVGIGIFQGLINTGQQAEDQLIRLESLLGSNEKALETYHFAERKAAATPFGVDEVIEGFVNMTAFGMDAAKQMDLVANMAAAMKKPLETAIYSVNLATQGMSRGLRQSFAVNTLEMKKFTDGLTPGTDAYREAVLKFLGTIPRFQKGMQIMAGSLGHVSSNIGDFFHRLRLAIVGLPKEGRMLTAWTTFLQGILSKFEAVEEKVAAIMRFIGAVLTQAIRLVGRAFDVLWNNTIKPWIDKTGTVLADQKRVVVPFLIWMELVAIKVRQIIGWFMEGWDIGSEAIDQLRGAINSLFGENEKIGKSNDAWKEFATTLGQIAASVKIILVLFDLLGHVVEGWKQLGTAVGGSMDYYALWGRAMTGDKYAFKELMSANVYDEEGKNYTRYVPGASPGVLPPAPNSTDNSVKIDSMAISIQAPNMQTVDTLNNGMREMGAVFAEELIKRQDLERARTGKVKP